MARKLTITDNTATEVRVSGRGPHTIACTVPASTTLKVELKVGDEYFLATIGTSGVVQASTAPIIFVNGPIDAVRFTRVTGTGTCTTQVL